MLRFLYPARNPIGSKGAQLLIKADMPALKELHACKYDFMLGKC